LTDRAPDHDRSTTNFADGAVSRYAIGADGRFLYAIDADAQRFFGWEVGEDGGLTPVGSWDGLPATVVGLAAS
jgi:hypothetical protein